MSEFPPKGTVRESKQGKGDGLAGTLLMTVFGVLLGVLVGFNVGPTAAPIDTTAIYCEGASEGWVAAHVRLYAFVEQRNPEFFAANFNKASTDLASIVNGSCLADPDAVKELLVASGYETATPTTAKPE